MQATSDKTSSAKKQRNSSSNTRAKASAKQEPVQNTLTLSQTELIDTLSLEAYNAYKKVFQEKQAEFHHKEAFKAAFTGPTYRKPFK